MEFWPIALQLSYGLNRFAKKFDICRSCTLGFIQTRKSGEIMSKSTFVWNVEELPNVYWKSRVRLGKMSFEIVIWFSSHLKKSLYEMFPRMVIINDWCLLFTLWWNVSVSYNVPLNLNRDHGGNIICFEGLKGFFSSILTIFQHQVSEVMYDTYWNY